MCNMSAGPQAPTHPPPHALALMRPVAVDLCSAKKVEHEEGKPEISEKPETVKETVSEKKKAAEEINAEKGSYRRSLADAFVLSFEEEFVASVEAWSAEDKMKANLLQGIYYRIENDAASHTGIFRQEPLDAVNNGQLFCYKVDRIQQHRKIKTHVKYNKRIQVILMSNVYAQCQTYT